MKNFLLETVDRLGMDMAHLHISDNTPSAKEQVAVLEKTGGDISDGCFDPTEVIAEENGMKEGDACKIVDRTILYVYNIHI